MRKLFAFMAAAALGLGGFAGDASALSLTLVATGPTVLNPGETSTFNVVLNLDVVVTAGTSNIDVDPGVGIISGTNNLTGTGLSDANFMLRDLAFNPLGACGAFVGGVTGSRNCTLAAPGAPSAGNIGGLSLGGSNTGTFTIGTYTIVANGPGPVTVDFRFRQGVNGWADANGCALANPTTNTLQFNVVPEPTTVGLLGLGLVGLVLAGRRSRA